MVNKIMLANNTKSKIEVAIEPAAEYFDWEPNKILQIELIKLEDQSKDEFSIDLEENMLVIYEPQKNDLKIFIDGELIYTTR